MKRGLIILSIVFLILILRGVFAIPYPGGTMCDLYGGELDEKADENDRINCILPNGIRCSVDPGDECSQYLTMPCAKLGETSTENSCCGGLVSIENKRYLDSNCDWIPMTGYLSVCSNCGNRICEEDLENMCNCPEDCGFECGESIKIIEDNFSFFPREIYGNKIVLTKTEEKITYEPWLSESVDYWSNNVYVYDIFTNKMTKITNNKITPDYFEMSSNPQIDGNKIVWINYIEDKYLDMAPINHSLLLHDLTTKITTKILSYSMYPLHLQEIYEDKIVWTNYSDDGIYIYNIIEGNIIRIPMDDNFNIESLDIYEDKIVWSGWHQPYDQEVGTNIYQYDIHTEVTSKIISDIFQSSEVQISGNFIAYMKYNSTRNNSFGNSNFDLYIYDIASKTTFPINLVKDLYIDNQENFKLDNDKIIFKIKNITGDTGEGLFKYDLSTKEIIKITNNLPSYLDLQGEKIIWSISKGNYLFDTYLYEICCTPDKNVCKNKECGSDINGTCGYASCGECSSSDEFCSNGECICTDWCSTFEELRCLDENSYQACGNYDVDKCLEWSQKIDCATGEICQEGECIQENTCTQTGQRQNNKYCSSEKIWVTQKSAERVCENNFECKSNICANSSCQSKTPQLNKLIYWIIGGLVALLLIILVFIIILLKKK